MEAKECLIAAKVAEDLPVQPGPCGRCFTLLFPRQRKKHFRVEKERFCPWSLRSRSLRASLTDYPQLIFRPSCLEVTGPRTAQIVADKRT